MFYKECKEKILWLVHQKAPGSAASPQWTKRRKGGSHPWGVRQVMGADARGVPVARNKTQRKKGLTPPEEGAPRSRGQVHLMHLRGMPKQACFGQPFFLCRAA